MKKQYFDFYPQDFLEGTAAMSDEEVGCYIRLLCHQWLLGKDGLPASQDEIMALIKRPTPIPSAVMAKFQNINGLLKNQRMEIERDKQLAYRLSRRKGAVARWAKRNAQQKNQDNKEAKSEPLSQPEDHKPTIEQSLFDNGVFVLTSEDAPKAKSKTARLNEIAKRILNKINSLCGKSFRHVESNYKIIRKRLEEPGVTEENVMWMLEHRWRLWRGTEMEQYFCPQTIFRESKFDNYLAAAMSEATKRPRTQEEEIKMLESMK
jgi:uncharacterized phage protein (TIGR02220 family)